MISEMSDTLADWKQEILDTAKKGAKKRNYTALAVPIMTYQDLIDSVKKIQESNSFTGSLRKTIIYSLCEELIKELNYQARKSEYKGEQ
ncbi:MAG: hypothetical protein ABF624_02045 [Liquorilactobacillus ghanensis]|uniref:hypothetical protein n=1 Tax=Liquorilactobacillus ghanensis TaxID=399370 RepID=UPI0039EA25B9